MQWLQMPVVRARSLWLFSFLCVVCLWYVRKISEVVSNHLPNFFEMPNSLIRLLNFYIFLFIGLSLDKLYRRMRMYFFFFTRLVWVRLHRLD